MEHGGSASPDALLGGQRGNPALFGSRVLMKFAKSPRSVSDSLSSSGAHANTVFSGRFPIAYSIAAECAAPRAS